jgi:PIN domain nuclease of toxin-antitoxin system
MRLLLDTHILLRALDEPARLDQKTRDLLEDPANEVLFSAASIWAIAIKVQLGWADFSVRPEPIAESARATGFTELPVRAAVAARVADLPLITATRSTVCWWHKRWPNRRGSTPRT